VDGHAQVQGLVTTAALSRSANRLRMVLSTWFHSPSGVPYHQIARGVQRLANFFAAGHLANAGAA